MKHFWTLLLTGSALTAFSLSSCAQVASESQADLAEPSVVESDTAPDAQIPTALETEQVSELPGDRSQTTRPQLIKRAYLSLGVT